MKLACMDKNLNATSSRYIGLKSVPRENWWHSSTKMRLIQPWNAIGQISTSWISHTGFRRLVKTLVPSDESPSLMVYRKFSNLFLSVRFVSSVARLSIPYVRWIKNRSSDDCKRFRDGYIHFYDGRVNLVLSFYWSLCLELVFFTHKPCKEIRLESQSALGSRRIQDNGELGIHEFKISRSILSYHYSGLRIPRNSYPRFFGIRRPA